MRIPVLVARDPVPAPDGLSIKRRLGRAVVSLGDASRERGGKMNDEPHAQRETPLGDGAPSAGQRRL